MHVRCVHFAIHTTHCWQFRCALNATQLEWKYLLMANLFIFSLSEYLLLAHSSYSHESLKPIKCILYQSWHKSVPYWLRYACWLLWSPNIALSFQMILHVFFTSFFPSHTFFMDRHNDEECILIHIHAHFDFEWSRNFPSLCINRLDIWEESTRL